MNKATVIGAGFAGVEAARQLSRAGIRVTLCEMKPQKFSPAHSSPNFAELVCSNSFKALRTASAAGELKAEMELLGSLCVSCAKATAVPAGGALAVDRDGFSALVTKTVEDDPLIEVVRGEVTEIPANGIVIIAAGPLASDALSGEIEKICPGHLSFYDAAAPIVSAQSLDMSCAFKQSRYDRGDEDDYINCPLSKEEYETFYEALVGAQSAETHSFDKRKGVYEGCMPIEVMALRGQDTIRFGPMKPVGLRDPRTGHRPWAVLQLRKENSAGTLYNLVGFQTHLKWGEQKRVFGMIPGLSHAEFIRYGVMHRNTYIDSPDLLDATMESRKQRGLFFAGQMTGVEGYVESAASGIVAAYAVAARFHGREPKAFPRETAIGALCHYISHFEGKNFQPMNVNFGLIPPLEKRVPKKEKNQKLAERALAALDDFLAR